MEKIQNRFVSENFDIPMKLCLDVDHGEVLSNNPMDTDPYIYLENFARQTAQVHLKQSYADKGGHWPFTNEHNLQGKIVPERVLKSLERGGCDQVSLILEMSFRERTPSEMLLENDMKESIQYWSNFINS